ncbi:D-methionine transport system permease protein [Mycetocola sp. BIGb0189]|uniref:methionine ABC transporter permease n=1 Tax=Mycetocola sp. BIGb0189 TaxID=2940604 RepID=UPI00216912E9|nr:methionine ABC transporter permease [Mycetocola sp. BIGb0189]MCS4275389.1 D-methionine transport system permease protein [Mycetocola sp. BIGb0189]
MDDITNIINNIPKLITASGETLYIVGFALLLGGFLGLVLGLILYVTRPGNLLQNRPVFTILNVIVNIFRPIPFLIFLVALQPLTRIVVGTGNGNTAMVFTMSMAAMFGISRVVEQNLLTVSPGVIEAARSVGASRLRVIFTVILGEALGPLILGYTFVLVVIVDMSALAGTIAGGGLGTFALENGYRQFKPELTYAALVIVIILVQLIQFLGNWLARKALRR